MRTVAHRTVAHRTVAHQKKAQGRTVAHRGHLLTEIMFRGPFVLIINISIMSLMKRSTCIDVLQRARPLGCLFCT